MAWTPSGGGPIEEATGGSVGEEGDEDWEKRRSEEKRRGRE